LRNFIKKFHFFEEKSLNPRIGTIRSENCVVGVCFDCFSLLCLCLLFGFFVVWLWVLLERGLCGGNFFLLVLMGGGLLSNCVVCFL
jgi:hypothetical protein